jgi:hypothetical protein
MQRQIQWPGENTMAHRFPSLSMFLNLVMWSAPFACSLKLSSASPSTLYSFTPQSRSDLSSSSSTCQGIARVYNCALAHTSDHPSASRLKDELGGNLVLESFFLHAILRHKMKHGETLVLSHRGHQNHRLDEVLAQRNYVMVGTGQEMWAHTCNRCTKIYQGEDGNWCKD